MPRVASAFAKSKFVRGPLLSVWRAATDNDGIKLILGRQESRTLARWLDLGLDQIQHSLQHIRLIRTKGVPIVEIVHRASGRGKQNDFVHTHRYAFDASGHLRVENTVRLGRAIRDVPRIGVNLVLASELEQLEWFGRGPWENYPDRRASAMVGRYTSTVTEQYVPYVLPQEHGHKTDVRWLTLTDADLFAAKHTIDLAPRAEVMLNLDGTHRGLGTASCGPNTLDKYRLLERIYRFAFSIRAA